MKKIFARRAVQFYAAAFRSCELGGSKCVAVLAVTLVLFSSSQSMAQERVEYLLGSRQEFTQHGHLRYLILLPPGYNPAEKHELWVNLHGSPGCASHAIFQYRSEAQSRGAILLAPEATEGAAEYYNLNEGGREEYHLWDMRSDVDHVFEILDEVVLRYRIDPRRVALLGFSAGCEMGWRLMAARPQQFMFFGGVANRFKRGRPPASEQGLRRAAKHVPQFYAAGKADSFAGPWFNATASRLKSYGFELRTAFPAGVGHDLPLSIKQPLLQFLDVVRARRRALRLTSGRAQGSSRIESHGNALTRLVLIVLAFTAAGLVSLVLMRIARGPGRRPQ